MPASKSLKLKGHTIHGALVFHNANHEPKQIEASLKLLQKKHHNKKIFVIFEPFGFSETKKELDTLAKVLDQFGERIVILPIFEEAKKRDSSKNADTTKNTDIDSIMIVEKIYKDKAEHAPNLFEATKLALDRNIGHDWIIVTIGAGEIERVSNMLAL